MENDIKKKCYPKGKECPTISISISEVGYKVVNRGVVGSNPIWVAFYCDMFIKQ